MNLCERRARGSTSKCKNGWLKAPIKGRCCRKAPRVKAKAKCQKQSCKWGKLKVPVAGRCCRKRPATYTKAQQQSTYWESFQGYRRRKRRSSRR